MTTFILIRHASCDPVGKAIAGRASGVRLNSAGQAQAAELARRLADLPIGAIYSSPLERSLETAAPLAKNLDLPVVIAAGLNEVDFGDWTGRTLAELDGITGWREFNAHRSSARIPNGETMAEVLARAVDALHRIRQSHPGPGQLVAAVSHGDVLRSVIAYHAGITIDLMQRLVIDPASVSILTFRAGTPQLLLLNSTQGWPEEVTSAGR